MFTSVKATSSDAEALKNLLNQGTKHKRSLGDEGWGDFTLKGAQHIIATSDTYLFYENSTLVATVGLTHADKDAWQDRERGDALYVQRLTVADGFHGRQLGNAVINWVMQQARTLERRYVRLDCSTTNTKLCAYYDKLGFSRVATQTFDDFPNYTAQLFEREV